MVGGGGGGGKRDPDSDIHTLLCTLRPCLWRPWAGGGGGGGNINEHYNEHTHTQLLTLEGLRWRTLAIRIMMMAVMDDNKVYAFPISSSVKGQLKLNNPLLDAGQVHCWNAFHTEYHSGKTKNKATVDICAAFCTFPMNVYVWDGEGLWII